MLWTAVILGFLGNFHCLGMCGPIALSLPIGTFSKPKKILAILAYNLGRIVSYAALGLIVGSLGVGIRYFGILQTITVIAGAALLFIGVYSLLAKKGLTIELNFTPIFKLKQLFAKFFKKKSLDGFLILGLLNGLLPCGLVYTAIIGAVTMPNYVGSAMYMLLFGLGTLPFMLFLPFFGQFISVQFRNKIRRVIPYSLILFGILFILRGANLGIPYLSPKIDNTVQTNGNALESNIIYCH